MRIDFHAVHWEEFMRREREEKLGNGLLTRALLNDEPLPWRRVEVDVDTDVDSPRRRGTCAACAGRAS